MKVYKIYPKGFASNSYILTADDKTCVVVDCAQERVLEECQKRGLTPEYVLLTHGHYDHIGGCGALYNNGTKIICGEDEKALVFSKDNLAAIHGIEIPQFCIFKTVKDGDVLNLCGMAIKVIATPGHTAGGVSYVVENNLFTGDTLFCMSVGRTDLPTGNPRQLFASIKKLYALKGDYVVYCGHDDDTTLDFERYNNPYVRADS
jgi:glyoxylase-like metal-dependent hydrolase (beta-lactamase superfamily II)